MSRSEIILIDCNRSYLTQSGHIRFPGRFIPSNSRFQQFSTEEFRNKETFELVKKVDILCRGEVISKRVVSSRCAD